MEKEQITGCHDGDAEDTLCSMVKEQITGCHDGDAADAPFVLWRKSG